jgi:hypothetical protein
MVGNQIETLTFGLSFSHNLCCKYSNGSCEPILNVYILRAFQWYNEIFNPMRFDPSNCSLKIQDSNSQSESSLESVGSFPHPLLHSWECECDSWVAFSVHNFPCPCFGCKPKTRVVT